MARKNLARVGAAALLLASTVVASLTLSSAPAAAAAPVVDLFAPVSLNVSMPHADQVAVPRHIVATAVIRHDPGTTVNGVRFDLVHSSSGGTYGGTNCSTTASITCSGGYVGNGGWNNFDGRQTNTRLVVRELPGQAAATTSTNSNYSLVIVDIKPPNHSSWQNDGPDGSNNGICGNEGGGPRACKNTASFSFRFSDTQTTSDQTMAYWSTPEDNASGPEDFPAPFASSSTGTASNNFDPPTVTAGQAGAVTINYTCDDNDGSGSNQGCDSARVRYRRLGDNAAVSPGPSSDTSGNLVCSQAGGGEGCETNTSNGGNVNGIFNADDNNDRTYTYRAPRTRGLYVIEALYCNESGQCPGGSPPSGYNETTTTLGLPGSAWFPLGGFYVNEAGPTLSIPQPTQTGGGTVGVHPTTGALHPNTGTTMSFTATTSTDAQVLDWNLDQVNTGGINNSGYESRSYGTMSYSSPASPGTPTLSKTASLNVSGYGAGASCTVGARTYDTGGIVASDPSSSSATATRTCTTNNLPTGVNDGTTNIQRGSTAALTLTANDADRWSAGGNGGDEAPTVNVTQPSVGSISCGAFSPSSTTSGTFACTASVPANTTPGSYGFSYTVTDSHNGTSSIAATGTLDVQNTAPTATGSTRTIQRGTSSVFNLVGTDPANGDTLDGTVGSSGYDVVSTAGMPAGSSVSCNDAGSCTVSIAAGTTPGGYSFTWNVSDNNATSTTATETITVANTAPTAGAMTVNDVQRGRPQTEETFTLNGSDAVNGDPLTYSVADTSGLPVGSTVSCTLAGACEIHVPSDTALADYSFTYTVNDNDLTSTPGTVTVGVGNTTPVANPVGPLHTTVGANLPVPLNGTDFNGDTLTYDAPITLPTKGGVSGTGASRTYVASNGTKGADSFGYTVSDNAPSTSTEGTVSIVIDNTAPTANAQSVNAARQIATPITLTGSDVNADDLTFAVTDTTDKGILSCDLDGSCSYTANVGESGTDTFEFVANDGTANSVAATVTITITNNDPTADDQPVDAPRTVPTGIALTGTDPNNDTLSFAVDTEPTKGGVTCDPDGSCTYTSDPGETGTDSFTFTVDDGFGGTDTGTVTITLTNSDPTANDQSVNAPRTLPTPIALSGNDPNGDTLTFEVATPPTKGNVLCDPDGSCSYTSNAGQTGTDSFTFTADDGNGGTSDPGTVTITLTNSDPSALGATYTVTKGIPKVITLAGTDPNGDTLTYTPTSSPLYGSLSCTGASCTYTASIDFGDDSFTFEVDDGHGGTASATVDILIRRARISIGDMQVLEPDISGSVQVPLGLSSPLEEDVTISYYTTDGTATGPADYTIFGTPLKPKVITISAGDTFTVVSVPIKADAITEPDEVFGIHIVSALDASSDPVPVTSADATVTILDHLNVGDDPTMIVHDATLAEGDSLAASRGQLYVQFSRALAQPLTIQYLFEDVTATEGDGPPADWKRGSVHTITIPAGSMQWRTVGVNVFGDTVVEGDESLRLTVILPDGAPIVQRDATGTLTLTNDD